MNEVGVYLGGEGRNELGGRAPAAPYDDSGEIGLIEALLRKVQERPRIEGPLPVVLDGAFTAIAGLLRKPSRLRGTRFKETPEYPEFAWREAILNAVAHRDYGNQGRSIEVSLFDDHFEVTSPGALLPEVDMDALRARQRVHQSRNPRLVRALVDLGFMRDQGEGIPRLFAEMEGLFLAEPEFETTHSLFTLRLQNTPTLTSTDETFLASLGTEDLTEHEFRAMLEAFRHGRVTNATMRSVAGLDIMRASRLLATLRDRDLLVLHPAGASSYFELPPHLQPGGTPVNSGPSSRQSGGELPSKGGTPVNSAEGRFRGEGARAAILSFCKGRWLTPAEVATHLQTRSVENLTRRHLSPMVAEGLLERRHEEKNHPQQAYRTVETETG